MMAKVFAVTIAAAAIVSAQSASGSAPVPVPTGISECVVGCVTQAAAAGGCTSFTDVQCVCTSQEFQAAALQCLQTNCTEAELAAALDLQEQTCGGAGAPSGSASEPAPEPSGEPSGSAPAPSGASPSPRPSGSAPAPSPRPSGSSPSGSNPSTPSQSGNAATSVTLSTAGLGFGAMVAAIGAIAGGAFIL